MRYFALTLSLIFSICQINAQNNSLLFDGLDDKVEVQSTQSPFNLSDFTIEAWINANSWKAQQWQGTILSKDEGNQSGYVLRCGNNGRLSFTIGTGSGWPEVVSNPIMQLNTWHHVAAVLDNGTIKIYIDGNLEASSSGHSILNSSVNLHIGESAGFPGRVFDGRIDEVRIWDTVRSDLEIDLNDTSNFTGTTPHLLAYYKFDQVSGTTLPNLSSTSNLDGTLINFPGNPWVSGFEPTLTDIGVEAIISPSILNAFDDAFKLKVSVKNFGIDTINSFDLSYKLNSNSIVSQNFTVTLLPGQSKYVNFDEPVFHTDNSIDLKVFAELNDDMNQLNDTISVNYASPDPSNPNRVPIFESLQHNFGAAGQSHVSKVALPENNAKYSQIMMNISVDCPGTGCDPWDQPAKISLLKNGVSYEIARFITPYGKACGPWTIDVTDFKSILRGSCDFVSYIQVWGNSGWLLNVSLDFVEGNPTFPYSKLDYLWSTDNWVYGEPTVSYDLPERTVPISTDAQIVNLRMTVTGHGQGNTNNAAEFSNFTHEVWANGSTWSLHNLWKSNCNSNSCSNQFGTWQFARAGWCPGQGVTPHVVNLTSPATPGQDFDVDYVLQPYTNLLNTGYNGSSHTEPHYKIHGYLVQKSAVYIDSASWTNLSVERISSPVPGSLSSASQVKVIVKNNGNNPVSNPNFVRYINGTVFQESYNGTIAARDSLEFTFSDFPGFTNGNVYKISVLVQHDEDQAANDDLAFLNIGTINISKNIDNKPVELYPNPAMNEIYFSGDNIQNIQILDLNGKVLRKKTFVMGMDKINISQLTTGTYIVKIITKDDIKSEIIIVK